VTGSRSARSRFLKSQIDEAARDVSALGNPAILWLIAVLVQPALWLTVLAGLVIVEVVGRVVKVAWFARRPDQAGYSSLLEKSDAGSFFSIHVARSAFVCTMLFFSTASALPRAVVLAVPLMVAISRLLLRRHRWVDVIVGLALGAGLAGVLRVA
jgi:membrane-associated phospholipid phosphatase